MSWPIIIASWFAASCTLAPLIGALVGFASCLKGPPRKEDCECPWCAEEGPPFILANGTRYHATEMGQRVCEDC